MGFGKKLDSGKDKKKQKKTSDTNVYKKALEALANSPSTN